MTKPQKTKAIAIVGGLLALAGVIYLYQYFKAKKGTGNNGQTASEDTVVSKVVNKVTSAVKSTFPLKKGSNNSYVKQLQQALLNRYGASLLPKYGADGDWGSETDAAVKSKLGITSIADQKTLNDIINSINP